MTAQLMSSCFCISSSPHRPVGVSPCVQLSAEQPCTFQPLMKSFTQKPLKQPVFQAHQRVPRVNRGAIHCQLECITEQAWELSQVCQMRGGTCPAMREQMDCFLSSVAIQVSSQFPSTQVKAVARHHCVRY